MCVYVAREKAQIKKCVLLSDVDVNGEHPAMAQVNGYTGDTVRTHIHWQNPCVPFLLHAHTLNTQHPAITWQNHALTSVELPCKLGSNAEGCVNGEEVKLQAGAATKHANAHGRFGIKQVELLLSVAESVRTVCSRL